LGFEIQELPDIIRVIVLLNLSEGKTSYKSLLKDQIDKVCMDYVCVEMSDLEKTLDGMASDGLVHYDDGSVRLTEQGIKLGKEWQSLLLKKEPIL
jgi:DNA-binding PadR family transcriptional regulator